MTQKTVLRISAVISGLSGIIILFGIIYPIVSYDAVYSKNIPLMISPVANGIEDGDGNVQGSENQQTVDYTQASNWFQGVNKNDFISSKIEYYTISIPKLKIESATVAIGGEDLSSHLIQYPGTALPGKHGNSAIFGHSILPIFYDPKNYLAIFSLLPTLKKGDDIYINYDGISYVYRVESMFEVLPTDIQVLDQDSTDSFLTLVTCVPPGDPGQPRRLVVRARVVPPT